MCPKPFSWAKNKRKRFSDGQSRGPLVARVALKHCPPAWICVVVCQRAIIVLTILLQGGNAVKTWLYCDRKQ